MASKRRYELRGVAPDTRLVVIEEADKPIGGNVKLCAACKCGASAEAEVVTGMGGVQSVELKLVHVEGCGESATFWVQPGLPF